MKHSEPPKFDLQPSPIKAMIKINMLGPLIDDGISRKNCAIKTITKYDRR